MAGFRSSRRVTREDDTRPAESSDRAGERVIDIDSNATRTDATRTDADGRSSSERLAPERARDDGPADGSVDGLADGRDRDRTQAVDRPVDVRDPDRTQAVDVHDQDGTRVDDRRAPAPAPAAAPADDTQRLDHRDVGPAEEPREPVPARTQVRQRYGGVDLLACLGGTLAAVGVTVLAAGLLPLGTAVSYSLGSGEDPTGPVIAGAVVLAVALLVGGWLAGRAARFDGLRNGLLTGLLLVLATAGYSAGIDASTDVRDIGVPVWLTNGDVDGTRVITTAIALAIALVAGALGGLAGSYYHRRVDRRLMDAEREELERTGF